MSFDLHPYTAGGDIAVSTFVKLSTAADNTVLAAGDNVQTVGVSNEAAKDAPIPNASALAGVAGSPVRVYPIGSIAKVIVGSGGVTRGALVKSDTNGAAVLAATTGTTLQWVAGRALQSALEGELVDVIVESYPYRPAIA